MKTQALILVLTIILMANGYAPAQVEETPGGFNPTANNNGPPENMAEGKSALSGNTSGTFNTAYGGYALQNNTTGSQNTANGRCALEKNISGYQNTAVGYAALNFNTTGYANTAYGCFALNANTSGYSNTAIGDYALNSNLTGNSNEASGRSALYSNTTGSMNSASGFFALYFNTTGSRNTAQGDRALNYNTSGSDNIAIGYEAGYNIATTSNNIDIGNQGLAADAGTIRLGTPGTHKTAYVAGISGATVTGGVPVYVTASGQLGTLTSSAKYKRDIRDMGTASDVVMALRPVTFAYKPDIDPAATPQYGLVAEEVEKVAPDLVVHDAQHQVYSVRYEAVNAMLLNEVQKQQKQLAEQQKLIASLAARLEQIEQSQKR